jgi:hypothetical protein
MCIGLHNPFGVFAARSGVIGFIDMESLQVDLASGFQAILILVLD